jgi:uncharacterized protein (DUF608 family)
MKYSYINKLIGFLVLIEIIYLSRIIWIIHESIFDVYEGLQLVLYICRIGLHILIGVAAVILFFRDSQISKWVFAAYIGIALIAKFWFIEPNSLKYMEALKEAQNVFESTDLTNVMVMDSNIYPYWWIIIIYIAVLVYEFMIKQRYNMRLHTGPQKPSGL